MNAPCHITTVDQHKGDHATGMRIMELATVTTRFSDFSDIRWEALTADDKEWWTGHLADMHAASVELASLDSEHRALAKEWLLENPADGIDGAASQVRQAIRETAAAKPRTYDVTELPTTDNVPKGLERVSLVTDDETGNGYYQVEQADGEFYLCDADGDKVEIGSWTLQRVLADIPADDSDAFFEAIAVTAKSAE